MRKQHFTSLFIFIISILALTQANAKSKKVSKARANEVVVYTYDSFSGEWGPGPEIQKKFEAATGYKLTFVDCGDGVQAYNRALLEKNDVQADVIVGIDNNLAAKAVASGILAAYMPKDAEQLVSADLRKAVCNTATASSKNNWLLTPYDFNHFSLVYDTKSTTPAPKALEDLTSDVYKKKIILMDPRTSTPGLGFVAWTIAVFGDKYPEFWTALKPNILTMAPGWSAGYGLFTDGEAPLVISYATDTAYGVYSDNSTRFTALLFDEGHIMQVEGYGLLKGAPNEKGAKAFMDFLISDEAQNIIPLTQWMYPANKNVALPDCYKKAAPVPAKTLSADAAKVNDAVDVITKILAN